ncbi:hypothetical protein ACT7DH_25860 [Bacillus pacificus]
MSLYYSGRRQKKLGVRYIRYAKRLLDFEFTIHQQFTSPLNWKNVCVGADRTESKETLDGFIDKMIQIAKEVEENQVGTRSTSYNSH